MPNVQDVYNVQHYSWDGNSRPDVTNYTNPWSVYASTIESKWNTKKGRATNSAIAYAKNQLEIALQKYESDLKYWQEMDERSYTSPSSQSSRYEDAGYNLGYLYSQVDSGNSAVGYNPQSPDIELSDTTNKGQGASEVSQILSQSLSVVTKLIKTGYEIPRLVADTDKLKWEKNKIVQEGHAKSLENAWTDFLRTVTPEGKSTDNLVESFAFMLDKVGYDLQDKEFERLNEFVLHCKDIYTNQGTDISKDYMKDINSIIGGIDSKVGQAILRLLTILSINQTK